MGAIEYCHLAWSSRMSWWFGIDKAVHRSVDYKLPQRWYRFKELVSVADTDFLLMDNEQENTVSRKLLVSIHLYLAAFFAPFILVMALTGGLYLLGIKGEMVKTPVTVVDNVHLDGKSAHLKQDVIGVLASAGIESGFDYVKVRGDSFYTRPTNRTHYLLESVENGVAVTQIEPSLIAGLIELHKGHGPTAFRLVEQLLAAGLIVIMLSGLYLGLMSPMLRQPTGLLTIAGVLVFVVLGYIA